MPADPRPVNYGYGVLKIGRLGLRKHPVEELEHLFVRIGTTSEEDDPRRICFLDREKSWIVEIRSHDDAACVRARSRISESFALAMPTPEA